MAAGLLPLLQEALYCNFSFNFTFSFHSQHVKASEPFECIMMGKPGGQMDASVFHSTQCFQHLGLWQKYFCGASPFQISQKSSLSHNQICPFRGFSRGIPHHLSYQRGSFCTSSS